jgi:acyl-CoA dehydrogenase
MTDAVSDKDFGSLRDRMRTFIDDVVIPEEERLIQADEVSDRIMDVLKKTAKSEGLWALGHPAEIGGGGLTFMQTTFLNEVVGRSYFGQKAVGTWSMQDSLMLLEHATADQRNEWLVPLVAGEIRSSVGLTEPEVSGSDPTLMQSTAYLDGDHWVVNDFRRLSSRPLRLVSRWSGLYQLWVPNGRSWAIIANCG